MMTVLWESGDHCCTGPTLCFSSADSGPQAAQAGFFSLAQGSLGCRGAELSSSASHREVPADSQSRV